MAGCASQSEPEPTIGGLILPHHLLVENEIRDFLEEIASRRDPSTVQRILLLSPNHFGYGYNSIQSTDENLGTFFETLSLDTSTIQQLADTSPLAIEPTDFPKEHGITVPAALLKEVFPNATLIPITLKPGASERDLEQLVAAVGALDLSQTLVVASVDFSHYVSEQVALANDQRTIFTLEKVELTLANEVIDYSLFEALQRISQSEEEPEFEVGNGNDVEFSSENSLSDAVAFDSPESLYVLIRVMEGQNTLDFNLWKRTSSASITGIEDPLQNTSHVFGRFQTSSAIP
jgi:AmmeMemoRadiSam system protein B